MDIYLSYYDIGMYAEAVAYEFETSTPNDNIYQYDGSDYRDCTYSNKADGDLYALAIFTADSVDEGETETIEKVGVGLGANASYKISILLDPVIDDGKLVSYTEEAVTTCNTTYEGYYLQELSEPVQVQAGKKFAVCVKADSGNKILATWDKLATNRGDTGYRESISDGQYYIGYSLAGLYKPDGHSLVIKAISNTAKYSDVTSISLNKTEVELDWSKEDKKSITLKVDLEPDNAYSSVKWKSSDKNVATVIPSEDGSTAVVEAHLDGECVITAVSYDKTKTASCTIRVHNADEDSYIVKTRKSGDLYWNINEDGVLSIYGSGDYRETYNINDYSKVAPWLEYSDSIYSANISVTNITNCGEMFYCCRNLETVSFSGSNTSNMLKAPQMFCGCRNLSSIDFTDFSMLNCKNINAMFFGCLNLKELDFGDVSFADNISASGWLEECYKLELIIVPPNISSEMDIYVNDEYYYWKDENNEKCTSIIPNLNYNMAYRRYGHLEMAHGHEVRLLDDNIIYGQKLSTLSFDEVSFVEKRTSTEVPGRLKWKYPDYKPDVTDTTAEWVFVPDDNMRDRVEGTISINVNRAVPVISIMPSVDEIVYNPKVSLGNIDITGGSANVEGTWSWKDDSIIPVVNNTGYTAVFTPIDEDRYSPRECIVSVNVKKATPILLTKPSAANIAIGDMLCNSQLYDGVVKYDVSDDSELAGTFKWLNNTIQPAFEDSEITEYDVIWMPDDSDNYNSINTKVAVRVDKISNAPGKPSDQMNVQYGIEKVEQINLNNNWVWDSNDLTKDLEVGITEFATANYIGEDAYKYVITALVVSITRQECTHNNLTEGMISAVSASCEKNGNIQYYKCKECGKCFSDVTGTIQINEADAVIKAEGHALTNPIIENEMPATCEKDGSYEEVVYCSVCNKELSRTPKTIQKLGHILKEVMGSAKAATCTQSGKEVDKKCSVCGDVIEGKVIEAHGHNWGEWTVRTPATETSEGVEERVCGRNPSHTEKRAIPKLSHTHSLVKVDSKNATCKETGNVEYWKCSECNRLFSDKDGKKQINTEDIIIAKTDHVPASIVRENEIKAICEKGGSYDEVVYCSVCGEEISRSTVKVDEIGHNWGIWMVKTPATETSEGVEERVCGRNPSHIETRAIPKLSHIHTLIKVDSKNATCEETGNVEYWKCSGCNRLFADKDGKKQINTEDIIIAKTDHVPASTVRENEVKATCEKDGSYEEVVYCSVCNKELSRISKTIEKRGHDYKEVEGSAKAAACTEPGKEADKKCSICGAVIKGKVIDARGHNYKEVMGSAKAATCTQSGKEVDKKCSVCGDVIEGKVIEAYGHNWGEWTVKTPATETTDGVEERVCNNDHTHKETRRIAKVDITLATDDKNNQPTIITTPSDENGEPSKESATESSPIVEKITVVDENTNRTDSAITNFNIISSEDGEMTLEYKPLLDINDKTVIIPENETIDGITYKVAEIADEAFADNKSIEKIVIGSNIEIIGDGAFSGCTNLKTVIIPTNVKEIGEAAFEGCKNLKFVDISSGITEIGDRTFANCSSLIKITIPAKVKKLGKNSFRNDKNLKTIIIKSTKIKSIGKGSFKNINKKTVIFVPKSLTKKQLAKYKEMIKKAGVSKGVKIKKK